MSWPAASMFMMPLPLRSVLSRSGVQGRSLNRPPLFSNVSRALWIADIDWVLTRPYCRRPALLSDTKVSRERRSSRSRKAVRCHRQLERYFKRVASFKSRILPRRTGLDLLTVVRPGGWLIVKVPEYGRTGLVDVTLHLSGDPLVYLLARFP